MKILDKLRLTYGLIPNTFVESKADIYIVTSPDEYIVFDFDGEILIKSNRSHTFGSSDPKSRPFLVLKDYYKTRYVLLEDEDYSKYYIIQLSGFEKKRKRVVTADDSKLEFTSSGVFIDKSTKGERILDITATRYTRVYEEILHIYAANKEYFIGVDRLKACALIETSPIKEREIVPNVDIGQTGGYNLIRLGSDEMLLLSANRTIGIIDLKTLRTYQFKASYGIVLTDRAKKNALLLDSEYRVICSITEDRQLHPPNTIEKRVSNVEYRMQIGTGTCLLKYRGD